MLIYNMSHDSVQFLVKLILHVSFHWIYHKIRILIETHFLKQLDGINLRYLRLKFYLYLDSNQHVTKKTQITQWQTDKQQRKGIKNNNNSIMLFDMPVLSYLVVSDLPNVMYLSFHSSHTFPMQYKAHLHLKQLYDEILYILMEDI